MRQLEGTAALVTGASEGIGAAISVRLASHGATVAITARRREELDRVAGEVAEVGGKAVPLAADLTAPGAADEVVDAAASDLGRLDIIVNNAGTLLLGPADDAPASEWDRMLELNLMGAMRVTRAALPHLLRCAQEPPREVADVVNIGSVASRKPTPNTAVYDATKSGLAAFSESLRQELASRHVRVSLVAPGYVATNLAMHSRPEVLEQMAGSFHPGTPLRPEDVADCVGHVVTRPRGVAINEVLVRGTDQVH